MNINNYKELVLNLPVREQCFTTKRTTWRKAEGEIYWLGELNNKIFHNQETLNISRQDIFDSNGSTRELVLKTIFWGYTAGMRGNHFQNILQNIQMLETALDNLKNKNNLISSDFYDLTNVFKAIPGLGLSTYSKLLYFSQIKFNGNPCLILDQRLIDVFASKTYNNFSLLSEIGYTNAESKYLKFLDLMNLVSNELGTKGENLEQFLFIFGNNLQINKKVQNISQIWDGYCPESLLQGKKVRMRLNQWDFFESEDTKLQICLSGPQAIILNFRGKGKFRSTPSFADETDTGQILSPQNVDRPPFNNPTVVFNESEEIKGYIKAIKD